MAMLQLSKRRLKKAHPEMDLPVKELCGKQQLAVNISLLPLVVSFRFLLGKNIFVFCVIPCHFLNADSAIRN